jgi:hypothetical protein
VLLLLLIKPVVLLTFTWILAVPPTLTGKVAAVDDRVKLSVVFEIVRLTVVEIAALPLTPVIVTVCGPKGSTMFAAVLMVSTTVDGDAPLSVTLPWLKLQSAPAGKPAVQLPGLETVELVKVTGWMKLPAGVMVMVVLAVCPAETLRLVGRADMVKGVVTVTTAEEDVDPLWDASPP